MRTPHRLVVDTNVFVSSAPRQVVNDVLERGLLLMSDATMTELIDVFYRPKLERYVSHAERDLVLAQIGSVAEFVPIIQLVRECRDPKDDRFLEVALNGKLI